MNFTANINENAIRCVLTPDHDIASAILSLSFIAPVEGVSGGEIIRQCGGYVDISLPILHAEKEHPLEITFPGGMIPANRAWLPLSAHIRFDGDVRDLPLPAAGVISYEPQTQPEVPSLLLCPQPKMAEMSGETLSFSGIKTNDPRCESVNALSVRLGLPALITDTGIQLEITEDPSLAHEGYVLKTSSDRIVLSHASEVGLFYGLVTLMTLRETHGSAPPTGTITDEPRFPWRGQHLDCARHYYEPDTIYRLLDIMATLKMNKFHWHFADDEAIRVEFPQLPELEKSHYRGDGELIHGVFGGGQHAGGFYSREMVDRIVNHAAALHIEVIPEIEIPAHALALAKIYPETRDPNDTGTEKSVQGYAENVMNPALVASWEIWENMVQDLCDMFPSPILHIGGDELPEDTWHGSPLVKDLMAREGLNSTQDVQGWTMQRMSQILRRYGKTAAAWEEATHGTPAIDTSAIIFSWTGQDAGHSAARKGHPVVMCPAQHTYLDMAHTDHPNDWGASWAAFIGLADTVDWDPVPDTMPEIADAMIGVESCFWSEFTTTDQQMEPMIAPRILGVSSIGWQPKGSTDPAHLAALTKCYEPIFAAAGWQSATSLNPPKDRG